MIPRAHRFHGLGSLNFGYKQGRVIRGEAFTLRYAANSRRKTYRVAVVVSKKVAKSAVTRNRIRRKIFAAVRVSSLPSATNHDLIFSIYQAAIADAPQATLEDQVRSQLQRAGLL